MVEALPSAAVGEGADQPGDLAADLAAREIERLILAYAHALDEGDLAAVAGLFAHGTVATEDGTPLATGSAEVGALYRSTTRRYDDGTPRTRHVTTNIVVHVEDGGDSATARSAFTVLQATDGLALQPIIAGRYVDRFVRTGGGWRFAERRMRPTLAGDLSHHLLFDAGDLT